MKSLIKHSDKNKISDHSRFLQRHAEALIAYAENDEDFASFLKSYIDAYLPAIEVEFDKKAAAPKKPQLSKLLPIDRSWAQERALWLLREVKFHHPESPAYRTLTAWSYHHAEPKDVVIGIVGIAIIGPTLGIIKKKRKLDSLQILFSEEFHGKASLSEHIDLSHQVSIKLLFDSLRKVSGDIHRLEPELMYWFTSDRSLRSGKVKEKDLLNIVLEMKREDTPHSVCAEGDLPIAVAISPSVRINIYDDLGACFLDDGMKNE